MRIREAKIYKKILISFLVVLFVSEIMIFGLFTRTMEREFSRDLVEFTATKTLIARDYVMDELSKTIPEMYETRLTGIVDRLNRTYRARVWLNLPDGRLIDPFPDDKHDRLIRRLRTERLQVYHGVAVRISGRGWTSLTEAEIPLTNSVRPARLHILYRHGDKVHPGPGFAIGLLIIGLIIAVMLYPVARFFSRPINRIKESALRIARGDLDHRVEIGKRRDEIGQMGRAFNHMADRLEQMVKSGRELTANVSHELRSPLTRIRVSQELIRDELDPEARRRVDRHLDRIQDEIEDLDGLIGRILELSKLDLGRQAFHVERHDPAREIRGVADRFRSLAASRELALETDLTEGLSVNLDREAFRSTISNLIDNAVKYTEPGGRIVVEAVREEGLAVIRVVNTHAPLSPNDLKDIFEPFHTVAGRTDKGTGLGLALIRRIVERLGGSVRAANEDRGLTLIVELPLAD